jgi:DNA-directed RNA polymerase specialized sigma24 family protein
VSHSASEVFTMQLARGAGKQANKFLHARGLQKADRDDVISSALLWCWENRDNYSLTTTLETWFMNAVRDAYKNLKRGELPQGAESVDEMGGEDTTYNIVASESAAEALLRALTPADRKIALLMMEGFTYAELVERGHSNQAISSVRKRLKQLRKLVPDRVDEKFRTRVAPTGSSDDADDTLSTIDLEIQALDFAPPAGKDCPPCWRCMWFEGFMPAGKRDTRMDIEDLEVREAVKSTEARKIEIAQQVRDGV